MASRELEYDPRDGWHPFREWLAQHNATVLPRKSPWEIYRAETNIGLLVGYVNRFGQFNHCPEALKLLKIFADGMQPPSLAVGSERRKHRNRKTRQMVKALIQRDGNRCFYCRIELATPSTPFDSPLPMPTIEHFLPIAKGGPDNLHNSVLACKPCNEEAGSRDLRHKIQLAVRKQVQRGGP